MGHFLRTSFHHKRLIMHDHESNDHDGDASDLDERRESANGPRNVSRRRLLAASATAGVGALALGMSSSASAAKVQESCDTNYAKIDVGGGFKLMDNQWSMSNPQCIWLNEDGSYGYDFDASGYSGGPNYPEAFIGTRPWGDDTGVPEFPIRRRNVDELTMSVDADYSHSGGEWDWAEEWWLMEQPPSQQTETHKYEVMLLLDWSASHDHGAVQVENAWTDQYGNTVDHWTTYNSGGTSATFFIFRISGGYDGGKIDMAEIVDYLSNNHGVSEDLYLSGLELGNEYWGGATGETTYNSFEVTVNGSTYTSGSGGGGGTDTPTPTETETQTETPTETDSSGGSSGDPYATIDPGTTSAAVGERITFRVNDTTGNRGWIDTLEWDFDDGTTGTGWYQSHRYGSTGTYTVTLTATINTGETSTHQVDISVS